MEKRKVIIIGDDHSNTLGVIRSLGENGIKPYLFVVSENGLSSVKKSKYIEKYWICKDEQEALLKIFYYFEKESEKPVIIPTSDKASASLDTEFSRLSESFILQNIDNKSETINKYMDKMNQYNLAKKYELKMANSIVIESPFNFESLTNIQYPIIIKPLLSINGKKSDISIVRNENELAMQFCTYKDKQYKQLLLQEYIDYDYECDMSGYCYNKNISISGYIQKLRIWPKGRGSMTFGIVKNKTKMDSEIKKIEKLITDLNYSGLFDVEFFVKGDQFYLNEINFRNSGLTYLYKNCNLCYNYYLSASTGHFVKSNEIDKEYYVMDEQADLHQIIERNISIKQHIKDKKKASMFLAKNKIDSRPSKSMFRKKLLGNLKLLNILSLSKKIIHKSQNSFLLYANEKSIIKKIKSNYDIIYINSSNIEELNDTKENMRGYKKEFKKGKIYGVVLRDNNVFVARAIIKFKGAEDRFIKIKNKDSYLFCNMYVSPEYRGKNIQCDLINILIDKYIQSKKYNLYSVVYDYNIPSWKNFEKNGFKKKREFKIIRFLKRTINKISL